MSYKKVQKLFLRTKINNTLTEYQKSATKVCVKRKVNFFPVMKF